MAIVEVASMTLLAAIDVISLVWMEVAMFAVAALVYMFLVGGAPLQALLPAQKKVMDEHVAPKATAPKGRKQSGEARGSTHADHRAVVKPQPGRQEQGQHSSDNARSMRPSAPSSGNVAKDELQQQATVIKTHARERNLASATRVFEQLRSSGTTLTPMIYNCFLDACVQCGDLQAAKAHFEEMKQLNFVDVVGFNTVLKVYLASGSAQEARDLVKEMAARGLQANKVTYNELLHAKVLAKDHRGLWSLVDQMREAGVGANSVTCSILLKSLTAQSHPADVQKVIGLIDEVEETIDEVLFSSVIEACIRIRKLDVLSDLMKKYREKGGFVNLTAPTYGSMIKAYGQSGDLARVRELWREMDVQGVKPTSITLGCMTEALVSNYKSDEAWELLNAQYSTEESKGFVNTVIYSTVLKGFAVERRIDKVGGVPIRP